MSAPWLAFVESNTSGTGYLFIHAAYRLGFRPILLTSNPSRYSFVLDHNIDVLQVNTQDLQQLRETCIRLEVDSRLIGITSSSEYYVATAADLAQLLTLPGPDSKAIRACRDKYVQRTRLRAAGLGVPEFRVAHSVASAISDANELGFPVIVKPASGSGSSGVRLCEDGNAVSKQSRELLNLQSNERGLPVAPHILVEEFISGPEFSVETFNGEVVGITQKYVGPLPHFVEVGHDFPALLPSRAVESLGITAVEAVDALGCVWGPAHTEIRLTAHGPRVIEVNPRLAGGFIPELVRLAWGIDLISATIELVSGYSPQLLQKEHRNAVIRFLLPTNDGLLVGVQNLEAARQIAGVADVQIYARLGSRIQRYGDFRDRVGHVIAVADAQSDARAAAEQAREMIQLLVQ